MDDLKKARVTGSAFLAILFFFAGKYITWKKARVTESAFLAELVFPRKG